MSGGGGTGAISGSGYKREVTESDWAKFGLNKKVASAGGGSGGGESGDHYGASPYDLYSEDQKSSEYKPWWKANFFLSEPVLFGTWDGVFTSVVINIFGIIVFLRTGWMVANAGINEAVVILLLCLLLALLPALSAIGICERCQIQSGGVYFLVSHILGGQIGGAVGVIYSFGQAAGIAMVAVGFGSSMASVFNGGEGTANYWAVHGIAVVVTILLVAINIAGVKWVIKLQLVLLLILGLSVFDFTIGSFVYHDPKSGVVGYSEENWLNNTSSGYQKGETFFTVFGVFFSTFTGVLSGVNMSGDLKNPTKNIPLGELAAIACSAVAMLLFILILGAVAGRDALLNDLMITEQVSWVGFLLLSGLYISSLSSILGSLYGAPRVLQCIAAENVIPIAKPLERGRGPNKVPVLATLVILALSFVFIMAGELNTLAKISTMPFLLTYAFVNYAYVSLAMTFDLQQQRDAKFLSDTGIPPSYGSTDKLRNVDDINRLFPERQRLKGPGEDEEKGVAPASATDPSRGKVELMDGDAAGATAAVDVTTSGGEIGDITEAPSIINQPRSWYSVLNNRYMAMLGTIVNIFVLFFIQWLIALILLAILLILYVYIGRANPGVFPGISEFSIPHCIRTIFNRWFRKGAADDQVIVTPLHPGVETLASRLTDDNADYSNRSQYHQSSKHELDDFD